MQRLDSINPVAISPCQVQSFEPSGLHKRKMPRPPGEEDIHARGALSARRIRLTIAPDPDKTSAHSLRESIGGKGMFLRRMQETDLPVPQFQCVTIEMVEAIEQEPLYTHCLAPYKNQGQVFHYAQQLSYY